MVDLWLGEEDGERLAAMARNLQVAPEVVLLKMVRACDPEYAKNGTHVEPCSGCGTPFFLRRRQGENHYCEECRENGTADLDRVRRWRHKRRAERS